jgi:hypothetical protein
MLEEIVRHLTNARRLMLAVAGAGFALVALLVLLYILLGAGAGPFAVGVVANLTLLIGAVGPQTLVAVAIVLAAAAWLTRRG